MNSLREQAHSCVVCAAPLGHANKLQAARGAYADAYPTCFAIACRMIVSRRADMGEAAFQHYLRLQARQTQDRQARNRLLAARRMLEEPENTRAWNSLRAGLPDGAAEPLHVLLPSGPRRARKVSARRRARYQAHLENIVAAARLPMPAPVPEPGPTQETPVSVLPKEPRADSTMPGRLCGICGGGCCTLGGEHAYLTPAAMRAILDKDPAPTNESIVASYLARVPDRSQAGSCINHTSGGCALPREMRSATCNRYACKSLAALQQAQREFSGFNAVIVVQRRLDHWRRLDTSEENPLIGGAVLTEHGVRRVSLQRLDLSAGEQASQIELETNHENGISSIE